jgi:lipid-A-disaccharide synthase-like uncharacterized protein
MIIDYIKSMPLEEWLGWIGGGLFMLSWFWQWWLTKKNNEVTFDKWFFVLRIVAGILITIEAIRVKSLVLILMNAGTAILMLFNLRKLKNR